MKTLLLALLLLLSGCAPREAAPAPAPEPPENAPASLWTREDLPVRVAYQRMWVYSAYAETEDPDEIAALVGAVKRLSPGAPDDTMTTDYTDILIFTFADGGTLRLEFENQNFVAEDGTRYHTEGLATLRGALDALLGDELE